MLLKELGLEKVVNLIYYVMNNRMTHPKHWQNLEWTWFVQMKSPWAVQSQTQGFQSKYFINFANSVSMIHGSVWPHPWWSHEVHVMFVCFHFSANLLFIATVLLCI
jgi:hypothetical protein